MEEIVSHWLIASDSVP